MRAESPLPTPTEADPGNPALHRLATLVAVFLACAHFFAFPFRDHPLVTDVRYFVYFAQRVASGAAPYRDLFDPKTPLATFLGAILYRAGQLTGVDPLLAIRGGYLGLAALAAVLGSFLHRRLTGGKWACGLLALGPQLGFLLLGLLPAIGNIPKLGMATCATAAALAVGRRAWILAGLASGLAYLDWQLGVGVIAGVLLASLAEGAGRRGKAVAGTLLGVVMALAPCVAYLASRDALAPAIHQTTGSALARAASTHAQRPLREDWKRRCELVRAGAESSGWLLAAGLTGIPIFALWMVRTRRSEARGPALVAAGYHAGILVVSARELQGYGDLFALLHTLAFFAAVTFNELWLRGVGLARSALPARAAWAKPLCASACVLAALAAQPWRTRGEARLPTATASGTVTLGDQARLAAGLAPLFDGKRVAYLGPTELAFLSGSTSALTFIYWNPATLAYFREATEVGAEATLGRLLRENRVEIVVTDRGTTVPLGRDWVLDESAVAPTATSYAVSVFRPR